MSTLTMHNPTASLNSGVVIRLASKATSLNRRIFASLPWGYRVAHLFLKMAFEFYQDWGRMIYAEFIKAGVEGLPDIGGESALSWVDKVKGPSGPSRLPKGYGSKFGTKAYIYAVRLSNGNSDMAEMALMDIIEKALKKKIYLKSGSHIKEAEAYILKTLKRSVIDQIRLERGRGKSRTIRTIPESSLSDDPSKSFSIDTDLFNPDSWRNIEEALPRSTLEKIMREVSKVDAVFPERAPQWIEAQLEGLSDGELAEEWGISAPRMSQWTKVNVPKIKAIFVRYLQAAA